MTQIEVGAQVSRVRKSQEKNRLLFYDRILSTQVWLDTWKPVSSYIWAIYNMWK